MNTFLYIFGFFLLSAGTTTSFLLDISAAWEEWGNWRCRVGDNGTCRMFRTRKCSTGTSTDCGTDSLMTRSCAPSVCPDKVKLEQSGQCQDYVSGGQPCTDDASSCGIITNLFHPICLDKHVSHDICPKACGCCEELPYWLEWSAWKCHLAPTHTCEMHRTRNCSTGSLDDCVGKSAMKANCSNTVCPELVNLSKQVDCSAVDTKSTKCVDGPGCSAFKTDFLLNLLCSDPITVAECPLTCGCCVAELPHWLEWSAWECNLAPNHTCEMHRTRNCSTGSLADCVGISAMTASCTDTVCPDLLHVSSKSDCSAFDYKATKCIDHRGCLEFKIDLALDLICSEPTVAAECPVTCGCCTNSSSVTTTGTPVDPISWSPWECHYHRRGHCVMRRHRICKSALGLEMACVDYLFERKECDESCKLNGQWADWQEWSKCSHSCSGGTRTRVRSCTNPVPSSGGKYCDGYGNMTEICNSSDCPEWSQWLYTACSVTCGNGTSTRLRLCSSGRELDCGPGKGQETVVCHETPCQINGRWADWQEWSKCSHSCSGGIRTRVRTCTNPPPALGGKDCTGNGTMTENCQRATCPEWSQWLYAACSVSCGSGTRTRLRVCSSGNDLDCGPGKAHDSVACNEGPCQST